MRSAHSPTPVGLPIRASLLALLCLQFACSGAPVKGNPKEPDEKKFDVDLSVALAEVLIEHRAHTNALPMLRRALERKPNDPRLHYLLGTLLRDRGVYNKAVHELKLAVKLDPRLAPAWSGLGMTYDMQGRYDEADAAHAEALKLKPEVARFHNNRGFSRYLAGDYEAAVKHYEEALRLAPTEGRVYVNLGFALGALGKTKKAMRMFRQTLDEAEALNNIALAHELRGDRAAAREMYEEALLIDPTLKAAAGNLETLSKAPVVVELEAPAEASPAATKESEE